VQVTVEAGREVRRDIAWQAAVGTVAGRVTSVRGEPRPDVAVQARADVAPGLAYSGTTQADGGYPIEVDPSYTYSLSIRGGAIVRERQGVPATATGVDFVLPDVGKLRLRLLDAATRRPVRPADEAMWAVAWRQSGDEAFTDLRTPVDVDGIVEMRLP